MPRLKYHLESMGKAALPKEQLVLHMVCLLYYISDCVLVAAYWLPTHLKPVSISIPALLPANCQLADDDRQ